MIIHYYYAVVAVCMQGIPCSYLLHVVSSGWYNTSIVPRL